MFELRKTVLYGGPQNSVVLDFLITRNVVQRDTQFLEKTASTLVCCILLVFIWECFGLCNFILTWFSFFSYFFLYFTHVCFPTYIHVVCIRNFKLY